MRQALHILKKDLRHLWGEIALVLVLLAAFTYVRRSLLSGYTIPWNAMILLSWGLLIARAIHSEALAGDRQFWLTRPYSRASLFAAKFLLFFCAITIPLTVSHIVILRALGFTIAGHVGELISSQALWVFESVVSFAALSAISTGLSSVALMFLLIIGLSLATQGIFHPEIFLGPVQWIPELASQIVQAVPAVGVLIWMFVRRSTFAARVTYGTAVFAGLLGTFLPAGAALAIQQHFPGQPVDAASIQPQLDPSRGPVSISVLRERPRQFILPILFRNAPPSPDSILRPDGVFASIETEQGQILWQRSSVEGKGGVVVVSSERGFEEYLTVDPKSFGPVTSQPVRIHTILYLTVFGGGSSTLLTQDHPVAVAGIGICELQVQTYGPNCRSAFGMPRVMVLESGAENYLASYEPFHFSPSLSPVVAFGLLRVSPRASEIRLTTKEPLSHIRREFTIDLARLADYQTPALP